MATKSLNIGEMAFEDRQALLEQILQANEADKAERVRAVLESLTDMLENAVKQGVSTADLAPILRPYGFHHEEVKVKSKASGKASGGTDPAVLEYLAGIPQGHIITNGQDSYVAGKRGRKPMWLIDGVMSGTTDKFDVNEPEADQDS